MTDLTSSLPAFDEIKDLHTIKMERVKLSSLPSKPVTLNIELVNEHRREAVATQLHEIGDHVVRGFLPTKAWWRADDDEVRLLFYVASGMPIASRPFGNSKSYIAAVLVEDDEVVEYESGLRIFIDQVQTDRGTLYLFLFGEKEYNNIVTPSDTNGVEAEIDCLAGINLDEETLNLYRN